MVEKEIEKQLSNLLKEHEDDIVESFISVLGKDNENLIRARFKGICPVFMANERDINLVLDAEVNLSDKKLLTYFLNKIEDENILKYGAEHDLLFIGNYLHCPSALTFNYGKNGSFLGDFLKLNINSQILYINNQLCKFYRHMLFSPDNDEDGNIRYYSNDKRFVIELLSFLGCSIVNDKIVRLGNSFTLDSDVTGIEQIIISYIVSDIADLICYNLHQKGIYLIEHKTDDVDYDVTNKLRITKEFYASFIGLFPLLITKPNDFINIVEKENFTNFAELVISGADENEKLDLIDKMLQSRKIKIKYEIIEDYAPLLLAINSQKEKQERQCFKSYKYIKTYDDFNKKIIYNDIYKDDNNGREDGFYRRKK